MRSWKEGGEEVEEAEEEKEGGGRIERKNKKTVLTHVVTMATRKSSRDETVLRYFGFVCDSRLM